MRKGFSRAEFQQLVRHWAPEEREIFEERMRSGYHREVLVNFTAEEAALMGAVLARLIPEPEGVDLVGFIDAYVDQPLGRGDRRPGMPEPLELFRLGLAGIDESAKLMHSASFRELDWPAQDEVLQAVAEGRSPGDTWQRLHAGDFFERFYAKALAGYFSHPRVWMRIGFMGSAYPEGYVWLSKGQVKQRHERKTGWDTL